MDDAAAERRLIQRCKRYGLSLDDFLDMWEQQGKRCAICRCALTLSTAKIDHYHDAHRDLPGQRRSQVRGLLCNGCNTSLTEYEDSDAQRQLDWMAEQVAEARRRLELYTVARPLYLQAVRDYLEGTRGPAADHDAELLVIGRRVPWRHHAWAQRGFDVGVGVIEFNEPDEADEPRTL